MDKIKFTNIDNQSEFFEIPWQWVLEGRTRT